VQRPCHDRASGQKWYWYADAGGGFSNGWELGIGGWCYLQGDKLLVGRL